jgi:putative membrane protein
VTEAAKRLDEWQHLSPWAIGLMLVTIGVSLVRQHLPLLLAAGAALTVSERFGLREALTGGLVALSIAVLLSLLYYRRFRFRFDGEVLVVQKGLFVQREFKLSARHVQQTGVQQSPWMRPFGVVQWEVETLAGESASIALPGIRREVAEALEARLGEGGGREGKASPEAEASAGSRDGTASRVRFALGPGALVLHGLTSRSLLVAAALLSPLVRPLEAWLHERLPRLDLWAWLPASPVLALVIGLLTAIALLMLLAVVAAWWRFHGYVLRDEGERQVQVSGLAHRRSRTLTLRRLQVVEWVQTGTGRLVGRGYLVCHQFGASAGNEAAESRRFTVPGLTPDQADALVASFWRDRDEPLSLTASLQGVSRVYRRVLFLRLLVALSLGAVLLGRTVGYSPGDLAPWIPALVLLGLLAVAAGLAQLRWKALGWGRQGQWMRVRQGLWGRRTSLFPLQHLVSLSLQQSWFQRRRSVATLQLHLANGRLTLPFLDETIARELVDQLLAGVERLPGAPGVTA